jgi:hypothetical protein
MEDYIRALESENVGLRVKLGNLLQMCDALCKRIKELRADPSILEDIIRDYKLVYNL